MSNMDNYKRLILGLVVCAVGCVFIGFTAEELLCVCDG